MKHLTLTLLSITALLYFTGCHKKEEYVDLETGKEIIVETDSATGKTINSETRQPVNIYVRKSTNDTIYGPTGEVINHHIVRTEEGRYVYDKDGSAKLKDGDYKVKLDKDGDYKLKDDDYKLKIDKDGDVKIKDGKTVTKIDGETGEKTVKKDSKF